MRRIDISGKKFGRLLAIRFVPPEGWLCKCSCGKSKVIRGSHVRYGITKSCGCLNSEVTAARNKKHGMWNTPAWNSWNSMLARCFNPNNPAYYRYGGRGIAVAKSWWEFKNFYKDMGPRPSKKSLERINNDRGYSKTNCKWATASEQALNRRAKGHA